MCVTPLVAWNLMLEKSAHWLKLFSWEKLGATQFNKKMLLWAVWFTCASNDFERPMIACINFRSLMTFSVLFCFFAFPFFVQLRDAKFA